MKFDGFEWYVQGSSLLCVNDAIIQTAIIVTFIEKVVVCLVHTLLTGYWQVSSRCKVLDGQLLHFSTLRS